MQVIGKACPYNAANFYNETIAPGAFNAFLKLCTRIPMFLEHDHQVGWWTDIRGGSDGLWVRGETTDPETVALVRGGVMSELSVSFRTKWDAGGTTPYTNARIEELMESHHLKSVPSYVRAVPELLVTKAALGEISIVEQGAFDGCNLTHD
jgi:HK97 family phage prohead protease